MSESSLIIFVVLAALCIINVAVFLRVRSNHSRNRRIAQILDRIRLASEESRAHAMAKPTKDLSDDFLRLRKAAPGRVSAHILAMERAYEEIERRTQEFQEQDGMTTLQSSVATLKTDKLVSEIHLLARKVEIQLGDPNRELPVE